MKHPQRVVRYSITPDDFDRYVDTEAYTYSVRLADIDRGIEVDPLDVRLFVVDDDYEVDLDVSFEFNHIKCYFRKNGEEA